MHKLLSLFGDSAVVSLNVARGGTPMEVDLVYFNRRAAEEKAAASRAEHPNARQAHLDLAERYEDLANAIAAANQPPALRVVNGG